MSGIATSGQPSSTVEHDVKGKVSLMEGHYGMKSDDMALFWDFDNRMSSADSDNDGLKNVIQKFDALGRRVYHFDDDSNATTIFLQFGQQTICDYAAGASPSISKYRYLYGSYIDEPVMRWETAQSDAVYYHRNQQYSIVAVTDDNAAIVERYSYTAYGEPAFFDGSGSVVSNSQISNRYTYTGREYDPIIRLYHFRARMYDPQLGRFLGRDPIGNMLFGRSSYEYLSSTPFGRLDPDGYYPRDTIRTKKVPSFSGNSDPLMNPDQPGIQIFEVSENLGKCGNFEWVVKFWKTRPLNTGGSYWMQHVRAVVSQTDCQGNPDPFVFSNGQSSIEYWEAKQVEDGLYQPQTVDTHLCFLRDSFNWTVLYSNAL